MQRDLDDVRTMARSPILLSREAQLLLLTASASPDTTALASLLSAGIDWAGLCDLAQRERAASIGGALAIRSTPGSGTALEVVLRT